MKIELTREQMSEIFKDGYLTVEGDDGFSVYTEYGTDLDFQYCEIQNIFSIHGLGYDSTFCFDVADIHRALAKTPLKTDKNYHICPRCRSPLLYKYNYCPVCGQALDWN